MTEIRIDCDYCTPSKTLVSSTVPEGKSAMTWRLNWKRLAQRETGYKIECPCCGGAFSIVDDGVSAESGGLVRNQNVWSPRIDALSITSGSPQGGEALVISGAALDVGNLVVKFDGVQVRSVTNRTATTARIVTPLGRYYFQTMTPLRRIRLSNATCSFDVNDTIRFSGGATGAIRRSDGSAALWIQLTSRVEDLSSLAGQVVSTSRGSGLVLTVDTPTFIRGEGVLGTQSGARGAIIEPIGVTGATAHFEEGEIIRGEASGACAMLGSPAFSSRVSVTVENEYGQRQVGGTLVGGFTYL